MDIDWKSGYGVIEAIEYYNAVKKIGADEYISELSRKDISNSFTINEEKLIDDIRGIISALDNKGRWRTDDMLHSRVFVDNFNALCSYMELKTKNH